MPYNLLKQTANIYSIISDTSTGEVIKTKTLLFNAVACKLYTTNSNKLKIDSVINEESKESRILFYCADVAWLVKWYIIEVTDPNYDNQSLGSWEVQNVRLLQFIWQPNRLQVNVKKING